jgi:hypothetical protein
LGDLRRCLPPIGQCQQHSLLLFGQSHFGLASLTSVLNTCLLSIRNNFSKHPSKWWVYFQKKLKRVSRLFLFHLFILVVVLLVYILLRKAGVSYPLSRILLLSLIFSVLATACLGQNYTQSLIPGIEDGIGVSNKLAYFIMGDDGWSHEKFKSYFDGFLTTSFILMALYIIGLLWESSQNRK